jgi:hypothetical protein
MHDFHFLACGDAFAEGIGHLLLGEELVDKELKGLFFCLLSSIVVRFFVVLGTKVISGMESNKSGIYDSTLFVL